jgi:D-methionine transport system ATP-binding protein
MRTCSRSDGNGLAGPVPSANTPKPMPRRRGLARARMLHTPRSSGFCKQALYTSAPAKPARTSSHSPAVIQLRQVDKIYPTAAGPFHALRDVDLSVAAGEVFGIIGRSGAGKSTLLRLLNLLEHPSRGEILIEDQDIAQFDAASLRRLRQRIGVVFQHFNLLGSRTVYENVRFPLRVAGELSAAAQRERVHEMLELVGLSDQLNKYPRQLSGGQRQRVGIARALANRPTLLLCDEATSALDPETTQSILALLRSINQRLRLTIVLITHGMDVIRAVADRLAVLDHGRVIESGNVIDVFLSPHHPTTRALLAESGIETGTLEVASSVGAARLLRITYRGPIVATPLLSELTRELGLDFVILQGSIGRIKDVPYAELTVAVTPQEAARWQQLCTSLEQRGIHYEVVR